MPLVDPVARSEYGKRRYAENREKRLAYTKEYYKNNRDNRLSYAKMYREKNREWMNEKGRARYSVKREKILADGKLRRERDKAEIARREKERWSDPETRIKELLKIAKGRARRDGRRFEDGLFEYLTTDLVTTCPCCLLPIGYDRTDKERADINRSPSIDRVDSARGYELDNVRIICFECNAKKRNATVSDLLNIVRYMTEHGSDGVGQIDGPSSGSLDVS